MATYHRTSSPVLTMTPQSAHQGPLDQVFYPHPSASFGHPPSWTPNIGMAAPPRGRKRSRDEAAVNLDAPEKAPPAIEPVQENEDEWEYGPGMVLIKKSSGYVPDASSQSGTWLEEKAAVAEAFQKNQALAAQQREAQERPSLRSHKSSRLDLSAATIAPPDASQGNRSSPGRDLGDGIAPMTPDGGGSQPVVDDFTLHLGIGWNRLSDDEHIQAAARGWARYIENHYSVSEPKILLESRGLDSYLVEAREGYFLFAENLRQGRLVSRDAHRALNNLKSSPPVFDGEDVLSASDSPRSAEPTTAVEIITEAVALPAAAAAAAMPMATVPTVVDVDMN